MLVFCMIMGNYTEAAASSKAKSVTLNYSEYTLQKGKSVTLKATVKPKNAKNKKITWSSSNKKVATVTSKGKVAGKKNGTAKITAKVSGTKLKAVCKVTVGQPVKKITVKTASLTLYEGESSQIKTVISPAKASNKKVAYESSNKAIATVSSKGKITAKKEGNATIKVKAKDGSRKTATVKVSVKKKGTETQTIAVTGVSLTPQNLVMGLDEEKQLTATVSPNNATNKKVKFSVASGESVVTVTENGKVTAKAPGKAVVKVVTEDGKKEASCSIEVQAVLRGISVQTESGASVIEVGNTEKLIVKPIPESSQIKALEFKSNKEECATVNEEGVITAIKNGSFTITVTATDEDGQKVSEEIDLRVGTKVQELELNFTETTMFTGEEKQIEATVKPVTANEKKILYSSDNETVATVTETGLIKAVSAGTANITATTKDGGIEKVCKITVEEAGIVKTVSSQEELNTALQTEGLQILKIETEEAVTLDIPEGNYANTALIVNAKEAHIENAAMFKNIKIESVGQNTFVEKAEGNAIYYGAPTGTVQVAEGAVSYIYLVEGAEQLKLLNNGQIAGVTLNTKAEVSIGGNSSGTIAVLATALAEDSSIVSSEKLMVTVRAQIQLDVLSGAEETEVSADSKENMPKIFGLGRIQITIEQTGDIEFVVGQNEGPQMSPDMKKITVTGKVMENSSDPMSGAKVYLIPYSSEITESNIEDYIADCAYKGETESLGEYQVADVPVGNYILLVQKETYQNVMETIVLTNNGSDVYVAEMIYMLKEGETATGNLSGVLYNAQDGKPVVEGITVRIRSGKNNVSGEYLQETVTNAEGGYSFENLTAGQYTVQVIDYRENVEETYIATKFNALVLPNEDNVKNSTITAVIGSEQVRFVLRWGDEASGASADLDSHLIGPAYQGKGEFHTWFSNQSYSVSNEEGENIQCADLDVDDTTWEGPETSTIYLKETGEYRFYVHDYSNRNNPDSEQMGKSSATVEVYKGNRLKATYNVPNQSGNLWYVCKYNALEDTLTEVNIMDKWDDVLDDIGVDPVVMKKTQLMESIEKANRILDLVTDETCHEELAQKIAEAQKAYESSEDVAELKQCRETLDSLIEQYQNSVRINDITGEQIIGYYTEENNVIYISGLTKEIPEYNVEVSSGSTASVENLTEEEYQQAVTVVGKGGYSKVYKVVYRQNLNEILGISAVAEESDDRLWFGVYDVEEQDYKELHLEGYNQTLGDKLTVIPMNYNATVTIEDSDKDEYVRKVTVSYGENSMVYYVTYTVNIDVFQITGVSDSDNMILYWDYMSWGGVDDGPYVTIRGTKPQLSDDFTVTTVVEGVKVEVKESDAEGFVKKLELSYGNRIWICYVSYEQRADQPYLISVKDKDNYCFKADVQQNNKRIYATGLNESISENLEVTVPEGMTYELNTEYISDGEIYIVVKNSEGESEEYYLSYKQDFSLVHPVKIEDAGNEIIKFDCWDDSIEIYGAQKELSENALFTMAEGVQSEFTKTEDGMQLKVTLPGTSYEKLFDVYYYVDETKVAISQVTDDNNEICDVYVSGDNIEIYGKNNELGDTVQFVVPEGATVTAPVYSEEDRCYKVTVTYGTQSKEYSVSYYQSGKFFQLKEIKDANNQIEVDFWDNYNGGTVQIFGANETIGNTLEVVAEDGLSAEVNYEVEENETYQARIIVTNGNASYTYYVYYYQN